MTISSAVRLPRASTHNTRAARSMVLSAGSSASRGSRSISYPFISFAAPRDVDGHLKAAVRARHDNASGDFSRENGDARRQDGIH